MTISQTINAQALNEVSIVGDYTAINSDGSQTIKGILCYDTSDKGKSYCAYRIHLQSKTVLLIDLIENPSSIFACTPKIADFLWNKYLKSQIIEPSLIEWVAQSNSAYSGGVDIRRPFYIDRNFFDRLIIEWNGNNFQLPLDRKGWVEDQRIRNLSTKEFLSSDLFGTVEEITNRLKWKHNVNRLDIEYKVEKVSPKSLKVIKTIYQWEHPDYPSHCLVRIVLHPQRAFVLITELKSNIPPHRNIHNGQTYYNSATGAMTTVINGIYQKFARELSPYQIKDIDWIYEYAYCSTYNDRSDLALDNSDSLLYHIEPTWDENQFSVTGHEIQNKDGYYVEVKNKNLINALRGEEFGTVDDSLKELGWRNY